MTEPTWVMSRCDSDQCKAEIIWAITEHGKPMPVDAQPSPTGNIRLEDRGAGRPTAVHTGGRVAPQTTLDGEEPPPVYTSHFATCPAAPMFRRRGQRGGKRP